jgi:integrase
MTTLAEHVENYLTVRRSLGFKLVGEEVLLAEFVACADAAGQSTVTTEFALAWARRPANATHNYLSRRLRAVRTFARYLHALDPACEVPSLELLPAKKYRPAPYLYRDEEIIALMAAAGTLRPPLRAATFRTIIGLLACTGLRIGEALALDRDDVDLTNGLLTVRDSKFGKSREVLLHPHHGDVARGVRRNPRPALPPPDAAELLRHHPRDQDRAPHDLPPVPRVTGAGRDRAPGARPARSGARSAP